MKDGSGRCHVFFVSVYFCQIEEEGEQVAGTSIRFWVEVLVGEDNAGKGWEGIRDSK